MICNTAGSSLISSEKYGDVPFILAPSSRPSSPVSFQSNITANGNSLKKNDENGLHEPDLAFSSASKSKARPSSHNDSPLRARLKYLKSLQDKFEAADHYRRKYGLINRGCNIGSGRGSIGRGLPDLISVSSTGFFSGSTMRHQTAVKMDKKLKHHLNDRVKSNCISYLSSSSSALSEPSHNTYFTSLSQLESDFAFMNGVLHQQDRNYEAEENEAKFRAFERSVSVLSREDGEAQGRLPRDMEEWKLWDSEWKARKYQYTLRKRQLSNMNKEPFQGSESTPFACDGAKTTKLATKLNFSNDEVKPSEALISFTGGTNTAVPPLNRQKRKSEAALKAGLSGWGLLTASLSTTKPYSFDSTGSPSLLKKSAKKVAVLGVSQASPSGLRTSKSKKGIVNEPAVGELPLDPHCFTNTGPGHGEQVPTEKEESYEVGDLS